MCNPIQIARADDRRLVELLRAGCDAVLTEIDRRYRPTLRAHAKRLLGGTVHDPEDAVQDTLVRVWSALPADDRTPQLSAWMHTVLRNRSVDLLRSAANRNVELHDAIAGHRGDTADEVVAREMLAEVTSAIRELPRRQREALVRHAWAGSSHAEIARELRTTPGASKVLVLRARERLREQVEPAAA